MPTAPALPAAPAAAGDLPPSALKVQAALRARGHDGPVVTFAESTRTAAKAAAAIGCSVGQIAKSLVFRTKGSGTPVLVVASGGNRVDEKAVAAVLSVKTGGEKIGRADAAFVRAATGYAIGGVPPVGHEAPILIVIDRDLLQYEEIWAAAGTPNAVFRLSPAALETLTGGTVADIALTP
ncbi:MAG: YbaK/EbsC family protein [Alphaproteobacteria bacterium]|nr:YbaK/EbsC family protein [Alphaproteobacteria bacterium]